MERKLRNQLPLENVKKIILKSKFLTIIAAIISNYYIYFTSKLAPKKYTNSARTLTKLDNAEELHKAKTEFEMFCKYGEIKESEIQSKEILEIGTGANHLLSLIFIANGAKKVTTIDKFNCLRNEKDLSKLYKYFRKTLNEEQRKRIDRAITFENEKYTINPEFIEYRNLPIEKIEENKKFDIIVSYYVFEHIHYMEKTIKKLSKITKKKGKMLAVAGVNDHGVFCKYHNEFYYLHINKHIWNQMTALSGRVNRLFISDFKKMLSENSFKNNIYVMRIRRQKHTLKEFIETPKKGAHYSDKLAEIVKKEKKEVNKKFSHLTELDLIADHFFIKAIKK